MKVSVIIPVFNVAPYISECIESVLAQSYQDFEVIAINDGSTDNSLEILEHYKDRIRILNQDNIGISKTLNRGIEETRYEYIAFIDGDDLWARDKLEIQIDTFKKNSELEIVFGRIEQFLSSELQDQPNRFKFEEKPRIGFVKITALVKKDVFKKYGLFPDIKYGDFIVWFENARNMGVKYYQLDNIFAYRRIRENSLSQEADYYPNLLRFIKNKLEKTRNEA